MKVIRLLCLSGLLALGLASVSDTQAASTRSIVADYSNAAIRDGRVVGVGVAVIYRTGAPKFFTFGDSFAGDAFSPPRPFQPDDLFEIGSVTKVFTTNLLGQAVRRKQVALDDPLSNYAPQLGSLKPLTSQVTLQQLADFTGGIVDYAPLCSEASIPGCLPSGRPTIRQYTAADFAAFFRQAVPRDFTKDPAPPAKELPAPYYYSDYSVGLLGLLLGAADRPLANDALHRWHHKVQRNILTPLGMYDTYLRVPGELRPRLAGGYQQALAQAHVSGGQVTGITLSSRGNLYSHVPRVRIRGGGGTGAQATATLDGDQVSSITVTNGGHRYPTPATVVFNNGQSTTEAKAEIIVANGKVIAISVGSGGAGYQQVPTVTIGGGRAASGRDATATAHLVNGRVAYLTVVDGGEGYVPPLSVVIEPGKATENVVPIWAPAGALTTTLADLSKFTRAALFSLRAGGALVPPLIADGFRIAAAPYACVGPNPDLSTCPAGSMRSGLSWAVQPADEANGVPAVISKNGGLPGFSTDIALMPEAGIAVVVMANSRPPEEVSGGPPAFATNIANNILYALFAACQSPRGCPR